MTTPTDPRDFDADVISVAALGDPIRRALYKFVTEQFEPVSREQAAAGLAIAHHVAKFHLDKLEEDGLLDVEYRRPAGRSGPGAGRPAKLYRRSSRAIAISLPERRYDLAGQILAEALTTVGTTGRTAADALRAAAATTGRALAHDVPARSRAHRVAAVRDVLAANGYEPRSDGADLQLINCPFHSLAQHYTELVCTMNLDLIGGLLDEMGGTGLQARLDPSPGRCCVTLSGAATASRTARSAPSQGNRTGDATGQSPSAPPAGREGQPAATRAIANRPANPTSTAGPSTA